ncbi:MAG: NAD kinase [Alphaproteobacteria bacterium]
MGKDKTVAFVAADTEPANAARDQLTALYNHLPAEEADVIVALGGDGFMLETLHRYLSRNVPIYGMHRGSVGFLMNEYEVTNLPARLAAAERVDLHPLRMHAARMDGSEHEALAINEVSLLRETRQATKIRVRIDGVVRLDELICDGIILATAAGSTAYNLSAHGPIIPIGAEVLALTPISAFRPRSWRGALLPASANIDIEVLEPDKRPVSAVADFTEIRDVARISIREDRTVSLSLLFDPEHNLEERILKEQFRP